ncbi:hypothetical protein MLD38_020802 [Melastoma candidum]|uniref:Uncharacterized protein n=1 Tax=Melastoma candidum TaxID=119954 RepID=A0ACB9QH22_9MYRT|nr:hypothetical protein MLD38_020802 [Melastoma candidum]
MLMGHTDGLSERSMSKDPLLTGPISELDDGEDSDMAEEVVYAASFDELTANHVKYDTIIWLSISLLLILAWGVGIIMLIYLPIRRYVLLRDLSSRKLYVTPSRIVYKISRPSFIPFWRPVTIENQVPLSLVIDIIIEQGWLQSIFGMHTFRIESIAHGKAAPVDEIQVHGISNPSLLRKVIIREASKAIQDSGRMHNKPSAPAADGDNVGRATSVTDGSTVTTFKSPSKSWKITGSPRVASVEHRNIVPNEVVLHKLEEVRKSVRKLEFLVEKSQGPEDS